MSRDNFKVGQIVILKPIGDNARHIRNDDTKDIMDFLEEWEVEKVGRKYVTVTKDHKPYCSLRFDMEDNMQVDTYGRSWALYTSIQAMQDESEFNDIERNLRKLFSQYGKLKLSLDQLKRINKIVEEA